MISRNQKDLFEKLLQDITRIIAEMLGHKTEEPLIALQEAKEYYLQWNEELINSMSPSGMIAHFQEANFSHSQMEVAGHFLLAEAKLSIKDRKIEVASLKLNQALAIFEFLESHSEIYSDQRRAKIAEINQQKKDLHSDI